MKAWLLAAAVAALGAATPYSVRLSTKQCKPLAPATAAAFGPDWVDLSKFAERCAVPGPDGRVALTVDVIRLDRAYAIDFFATHSKQQVPFPIIRDRQGTPVGFLNEQFPEDPPSRLQVTFARWRKGWPHEIRLYEAGESAFPPHAEPPMRWNARDRVFYEAK